MEGWKGVGDVVHRPQVEAVLLILRGIERRDENDRDLPRRVVMLQRLDDLMPVHVGHHHVEQDQVGLQFMGPFDGLNAILGQNDAAVVPEQFGEEVAVLLVIDHENLGELRRSYRLFHC